MIGQFALFVVLALAARAHALPPQRISGGEDAAPGEFPYQVSIRFYGEHMCGGSIISDRHILTAAHCLNMHSDNRDLRVVTGALFRRRGEGEKHKVLHVGIHDGYATSKNNDIGLIQLASPIEFSDTQNKIDLPSAPPPSNVMATVSGWGMETGVSSGTRRKLKKLQMETFTAKDCGKRWTGWASVLDDRVMCAFIGKGRGVCSGDSGGGLAYNGTLIGIVSRADCPTSVPNIFTNVYHHLDWITMMIGRFADMGE